MGSLNVDLQVWWCEREKFKGSLVLGWRCATQSALEGLPFRLLAGEPLLHGQELQFWHHGSCRSKFSYNPMRRSQVSVLKLNCYRYERATVEWILLGERRLDDQSCCKQCIFPLSQTLGICSMQAALLKITARYWGILALDVFVP